MQKVLITVLALGVIPLILGIPWTKIVKSRYSLAFVYAIGNFMELTLFHIVAFPVSLFDGSFHMITILYSVCLVLCCGGCIWYIWKNKLLPEKTLFRQVKSFFWYEWILLAAILGVIGIQLVRGFTHEFSYMSWDDATYTVYATDTLFMDQVSEVDPLTGVAAISDFKRTLQTSLIFPSWLSAISGISVPVIEHTIQYVQLLLLAYLVYVYMARELFEERINRLIFLLILSVFFIYGYYSHYTLTFRLLGPNYQGKAILAVSLTPLVFTLLIQKLSEPYQRQTGLMLSLLSLTAISLSLWGAGTFPVIVTVPILLSLLRKKRNWKHLLYIPWACFFPGVSILMYVFNILGI